MNTVLQHEARQSAWIPSWQSTSPLILSYKGAAFGTYGIIDIQAGRIKDIKVVLRQGENCCEASHVSFRDGMIERHAANDQSSLKQHLNNQFYVSAVFPSDPRFVNGLVSIEVQISARDREAATVIHSVSKLIKVSQFKTLNTISKNYVGIALATHNPDLKLFAQQVQSIRSQNHKHWLCIICDDGSKPETLSQIRAAVGDDTRFKVISFDSKVGFYRNFERACAVIPKECEFIAFSDQDDVWSPNRLSHQIKEIADIPNACSYSDMDIVDDKGVLLSHTFWVYRKPEFGSIVGLLLANVVTGMTVLAKRDIIDHALPFPATPGLTYHDHWIALIAQRLGGLRYIPDPLVHYVQHGNNHTGALTPWSSRAVLARAVKRLARITGSNPFSRSFHAVIQEPYFLRWADEEPARLRILVDRLIVSPPEASSQILKHFVDRLGFFDMARSGANWSDAYRRSVAIDIAFGALAKKIIIYKLKVWRAALALGKLMKTYLKIFKS